jgi:ferric-dicitrate binding protein FerR (iron transport regulator)
MQENIHGLLGKYFNGQASVEEIGIIKNWAAASEENAADFRLLEKLWNKTGEQEQHVFDTNQAWLTVHAKLQNAKQRPKTITMMTRRAVAVAAAIILLLGAWWIFFPSGTAHIITADTAIKQVKMDDGSTIWLREGATIEYANSYGKQDRKLNLIGEAFFEVAPDTSLPFIIAAANTQVRVVGTSFLVNTNNDQVELVVKTGKVQFSNGVNQIVLTAGERSLDSGGSLAKEINSNPNYNSWQTDSLVFDGTFMHEVVKALNKHFGAQVSIRREDSVVISKMQITARFVNKPLKHILDVISSIGYVKITELSEKRYEISYR